MLQQPFDGPALPWAGASGAKDCDRGAERDGRAAPPSRLSQLLAQRPASVTTAPPAVPLAGPGGPPLAHAHPSLLRECRTTLLSPAIPTAPNPFSGSAASPAAAHAEAPTVAERYLTGHTLQSTFASRYTILAELGSGGYGFVCSARRLADGREVAVKFIFRAKMPSHHWTRDATLGPVPIEVFLLRHLRHENLIEFLDYYEDPQFFYLVMGIHGKPWTDKPGTAGPEAAAGVSDGAAGGAKSERRTVDSGFGGSQQSDTGTSVGSAAADADALGGLAAARPVAIAPRAAPVLLGSPLPSPRIERRTSQDLFEAIEHHQFFSEQIGRHIFRQIVAAVSYLHACRVVHRDIKDENILLDQQFNVKLIDLGSATVVPVEAFDEAIPYAWKMANKFAVFDRFYGTIQYAAPEILKGNNYHGPSSDIWSMGCCLYVILFGQVPFASPSAAIAGKFSVCSNSKIRLSSACWQLLRAMLEPNPAKRATIRQIRESVWLQGTVVSSESVGGAGGDSRPLV